MRKVFVALLFILACLAGFTAGAAVNNDRFEATATIGATEQEADEGYFSFGQGSMVVARQGSELHAWLKAHVGRRVKLSLETEPAERQERQEGQEGQEEREGGATTR